MNAIERCKFEDECIKRQAIIKLCNNSKEIKFNQKGKKREGERFTFTEPFTNVKIEYIWDVHMMKVLPKLLTDELKLYWFTEKS